MPRLLFSLFAALSALESGAIAQQVTPPLMPPRIDVERIIAQALPPGQRLDRFMESTKRIFQMFDLDRDGAITEKDRQLSRQGFDAQRRAPIIAQLLRADYDGDGIVTREEMQSFVEHSIRIGPRGLNPEAAAKREQSIRSSFESLMRADTNGDGRIDWSEMFAYAKRSVEANPQVNLDASYRIMMVFDTNRDGRTTVAEFETGLEKRFVEVDTDGDGVVSREEFNAYWQRVGAEPPKVAEIQTSPEEKRAEACKLPRAPKDAQIVVVNVHDMVGFSTVAIETQDEVTYAARVSIESGREPLYLILITDRRVIWRFEGAVHRLKHVVLASKYNDGKVAAVGATGLSKDVIAFGNGGYCSRFWVEMGGLHPEHAKHSVYTLAGRPSDSIIHVRKVWNLRLPSGQVSEPSQGIFGIPIPGFGRDDSAPPPVLQIDAAKVIAGRPAVSYEVLPGEVGLKQLLDNGTLRPTLNSNEFLILKSMQFPAGLERKQFWLPKGVPVPTGNPGQSVVFSQESKVMLCHNGKCSQ